MCSNSARATPPGGKMSFAEFLDIMHQHTKKEAIPREIVQAFRGHDSARRGLISARALRHILLRWGECLSPREGQSPTPAASGAVWLRRWRDRQSESFSCRS